MDYSHSEKMNLSAQKTYSFTALLVLVAGIIISITMYIIVESWEQTKISRTFELGAQNHFASIQTEIIRHQEVVTSIAGLFSSSEFVTRKEFKTFVQDSLRRHPDIKALSWNPVIKPGEKELYIKRARNDGFADFQFKNSKVNITSENDNAVAVFYIEPYEGNEQALGFNIASHPSRLKAIKEACDTGKIVSTERITLVQEKEQSYGYLLFKSIYSKGKPTDTIKQRQNAFSGLAVGVFRFGDLFAMPSKHIAPTGIDMWIFDRSAPVEKQFLHYKPSTSHKELSESRSENYKSSLNRLNWKTKIDVHGREWEFLFSAAPGHYQNDGQAWGSLIAGLLFTLLLATYLQSRHRQLAFLAIKNDELIEENRQRKLYELKAKEQRDFSNTILEASANVIVVIDLDGCIVLFNPAAERITGFNSDEVIGKPVWETVIPSEQEAGVRKVFENLKKGQLDLASEYENEWLTKDGGRNLLHWSNSVLYNDEGKVSFIMALGYDITEQRENKKQQERLSNELKQAQKMESLGQLTGGIAHDFNNILGIILGYSDLAITKYSDKVDSGLIKYVQNIYEAGERASKLIEQMLTFSRGDQTKNFPIKLAPLIVDEIKMLRSTLPSTIEIVESIDSELPYVFMNPTQLHQVLMNLSINAADAMNSTGTLTIKLGLTKDLDTESPISHKPIKGDWVELSVTDTGSGIEPDIMNNIFDPFFTTKEVGKGTGMGLSVIYRIMDDHYGHILIESEQGKGTTFRMLFPPHTSDENSTSNSVQADKDISKGMGAEILIVDDEKMLASQLADMVETYDYKAHSVTDSPEALKLFKDNPDRFSLLITDQTMPKMTGIELIEKIREINADFPVIMCSGYSNKIDANSAENLKISYFDKPVDIKKLLLKISELLKTPE